ncbi:transferase hexapeptide protein [Catovirus CTV1]|mgnify:CR=1 FL=1|uniref:Transferase hexapeptide protein n=1 Tax=Catovirus CTV1 TaxID=1977631 RepID=A0A1V0SAW9_9VIRU|nr:transferase hexapeptide protein [Catovirus CTV1]
MSILKSSNNIIVGKRTFYNGDIKLISSNESKIFIGSFCAIGNNLKIITLNHDYNYPAIQGNFYKTFFNQNHPGELNIFPNKERTKGDVYIGNDVWIGDDVTILSGVTIGDGCCIGTKSLITKSLPPYSVCGGVPCKVIKNRYSDDIVKYLMEIKWWEWSEDKIKKNKSFFYSNLNKMKLEDIKKIII